MSATVKTKIQWKKDVLEKVVGRQEKALVAAGFQLESYIKRHFTGLSKSSIAANKAIKRMGGKVVHAASSPGQPPAVDTGRLRASISTNWTQSGMARGRVDSKALEEDGIGNPGGKNINPFSGGQFKVAVGTNVDYGPPLEFGTVNMAARPFMRPAYDFNRNKITKMMARNK